MGMIVLLTACGMQDDNYVSNYTRDIMENKNMAIYVVKTPVPSDDSNINNSYVPNADDSINETNQEQIDYYKQGEVIDCITIDECINKANIIKQKFSDIISNVFYLEIVSSNGDSLGYYNEYSFNEIKYQDMDTCINIGNTLKDVIKLHNIDFTCNDDFVLKVVTSQ